MGFAQLKDQPRDNKKNMRNWKPLFFENSKIPVWLSYLAPIKIGAICIGPFVFARHEVSETTRRHETIHLQQQLELLFIGTAILYLYDWLKGLIKYRDGRKAYYQIRAEQEAYVNQEQKDYLKKRKRWQWLKIYKV